MDQRQNDKPDKPEASAMPIFVNRATTTTTFFSDNMLTICDRLSSLNGRCGKPIESNSPKNNSVQKPTDESESESESENERSTTNLRSLYPASAKSVMCLSSWLLLLLPKECLSLYLLSMVVTSAEEHGRTQKNGQTNFNYMQLEDHHHHLDQIDATATNQSGPTGFNMKQSQGK